MQVAMIAALWTLPVLRWCGGVVADVDVCGGGGCT